MSKFKDKKGSEFTTVSSIKNRSITRLRNDFLTLKNNCIEEAYDDDVYVYVDENNNCEEYYPWMFSKTLEHDPVTGFCKKKDVDKIIKAAKEGGNDNLNAIDQFSESKRKLEGVAASNSFNHIGTDSSVPSVTYQPIYTVGSVFEQMEVYALALNRDVSFWDIENNNGANGATLTSLNSFNDKTTAPVDNSGDITDKILFRGSAQDELVGPYVSQFLYLPFNYGNIAIEQKYENENDVKESVILSGATGAWINIQNGKVTSDESTKTGNFLYCHSPRVLGAKVHNDALYQFYYNAALIAFQNGIGPSAFQNDKSSAWVSSGGPDVLASVAHVALGALRVAWYQKFCISMRIRPEVYAQRINLIKTNTETFIKSVPRLKQVQNNLTTEADTLLEEVKTFNANLSGQTGTYLLPLQFTEGSPVHPSLPAGHAVVAGACVTVLKAMLSTHDKQDNNYIKKAWPLDVKHSLDGTALDDYTGDIDEITIVGELNKLASNVSIGRNMAGVHYRADGDCGMKLGEIYALTYLVDKASEYSESYNGVFDCFVLEKFDGTTVKISKDGVVNV
jgi:hypothetical protein